MESREVCAVCLEELEENTAQMPGCGHIFHTCCLINAVQYDTRCPVCRQIGNGVLSRQSEMFIVASSIELETNDYVTVDADHEREWRRYTDKRRRLLRQRQDLKRKMEYIKSIRNDMRQNLKGLERAYQKGCKAVWKTDTDVVAHKKKLSNLRRKELRLSRELNDQLEVVLGPEP